MLIVPELETVFILVPRTGSGTLYRTVLKTYPKSFLLYRHMEADGVPQGYDRWKRVGFVRHPTMRLWSLYKFMKTWSRGATAEGKMEADRIRSQVEGVSFEDWLLNNHKGFTTPVCQSGMGQVWPILSRRDPSAENRRSQFTYLRPDLGTIIHKFEDIKEVYASYGLYPEKRHNKSEGHGRPHHTTLKINAHIKAFCAWDLEQGCKIL